MVISMLDLVRYFLTYKNHSILSAVKFVFFLDRKQINSIAESCKLGWSKKNRLIK